MTRKQRKILFRIIISAVLLIGAAVIPFEEPFKLIAFLLPYAVISYDIIIKSIRNIFHGEIFDENFLMMIASVGAFFINEYPEAVLVIILYQVGELFQAVAVGKSRKSISELANLCPDTVSVIRNGEEIYLSPEEIFEGETIVIRPGERIPLDGKIIEGRSDIDTSALTGESFPRSYFEGDSVISGSLNLNGLLKVQVSSSYGESTISKIITLIEESSTKKATVENFITKFARYYTPCVVISALALAILPPLLFSADFSDWLTRALIFLVVSCPCALVISVPLSFFGGIGGASKNGILFKSSSYIEILSKSDILVFDKTGTLTEGTFEVSEIYSEKMDKSELLELTALAESYSNHPVALSIVASCENTLDKARVSSVNEIAGMGISAVIDGKNLLVGNSKFMEEHSVKTPAVELTAVHVAREREYLGYILLSDKVKEDAFASISAAKKFGIKKTVMLTGDSKEIAEKVGAELGIDEIRASLLPADKVYEFEKISESKVKKSYVAFVGDGINDAPVMTAADVSIAMKKSGSDIALEAADVVIINDRVSSVLKAIKISKKTMRIVHQNIIFALSSKGIVLILGALGFANMWIAIFADVGILILAVLNAMRTLKKEK
ncbi:MAG: cadmium-translocating P-type ATPase [Ruminococcaceae bacterium]|nr:cadmium-translocating P-type ATPase [Oscillospiraceae bacterium]